MIKIDWKEVFVTLNGTIVRMPKTVKVPVSLLCFHLSLSCTIHSYLYAVACKDNSQAACCLLTLYSVKVVTCGDEM